MMRKKVAVSDSLAPVKRLLQQNGFDVVNLDSDAKLSEKGMEDYDAVVVSGMDINMLGMQDISGRGVVIDAAGRRPEEIVEELNVRLP